MPLSSALVAALLAVSGGLVAVRLEYLSPMAAVLLAGGLVGGLAYSLPPVAAMRRGWGEAINALLGGMLLPLFGVAVARGTITVVDVAAFLPFTLVVFGSVLATAWPDRAADASTGKHTLQVRWSPVHLRGLAGGVLVASVVATVLAAAVGASPVAWLGLLVLPAQVIGWTWYTRRTSPLPSVVAMVGMAGIGTLGLTAALR